MSPTNATRALRALTTSAAWFAAWAALALTTPHEACADLLSDWRRGQADEAAHANLEDLLARVADLPPVAMPMAEAAAATHRAKAMDTLPDPMLTVGVMGLPWASFRLNQSPMSGVEVGLTWSLPWPGMRAAEAAVEEAMGLAMRANRGEVAWGLERQVAEMYWQVHTIDRALETLDPLEALLRDMQRLAQARYRFSTNDEADVLRANAAIGDLGARRVEMLGMRAQMVAALNAMLLRPHDAPLTPTPRRAPPTLPSPPPSLDVLLAQAQAQRPTFRALDAQAQTLTARDAAADYARYPMLMVGASHTFRMAPAIGPSGSHSADDGLDFLGLMVGVTLPFSASQRADATQAALLSERHALTLRREETLWMLRADIAAALATLDALSARLAHLHAVSIPDAQSAFDTLAAIYPTGGCDFMDLLSAAERVLMLDMQHAEWTSLTHSALDTLARLTQPPTSVSPPHPPSPAPTSSSPATATAASSPPASCP